MWKTKCFALQWVQGLRHRLAGLLTAAAEVYRATAASFTCISASIAEPWPSSKDHVILEREIRQSNFKTANTNASSIRSAKAVMLHVDAWATLLHCVEAVDHGDERSVLTKRNWNCQRDLAALSRQNLQQSVRCGYLRLFVCTNMQ